MSLINILKEEWKEKPTSHKVIAILGGLDVLISIITPLMLALIWIRLSGLSEFSSYLIYVVGLLATFFRAIKFWIKK